MRKTLAWILAAGCVVGSYATDARVAIMGRDDAFYRDVHNVFKNPASIGFYPNVAYGSYGVYIPRANEVGSTSGITRFNRDPDKPFFGAIVSNRPEEGGKTVSFGAVFNRYDRMKNYILPIYPEVLSAILPDTAHTIDIKPPLGKVDLMGSMTTAGGMTIGLGAYFAHQKITDEKNNVDYQSGIYKGTFGLVAPVAEDMDFEASVNYGLLTAKGLYSVGNTNNIDTLGLTIADRDWFGSIDLRLFSGVPALNATFVPQASFQMVNLHDGETRLIDVNAGLGLNLNIDRGFFFAGIQGLYSDYNWVNSSDLAEQSIGGRVSFGVERNLVWDWFVIRVGGQKILKYATQGKNVGQWIENPESDASDQDLVGLGFGLNIENRLRIDVVAAEDIVYTFTNLFSGPQHHLFKRVSATYSF